MNDDLDRRLFYLTALQEIYNASCLVCRHPAVRYNVLVGRHECDWCRIAYYAARRRELLRLMGVAA